MFSSGTRGRAPTDRPAKGKTLSRSDLLSLLRNSHIFASTAQEVLHLHPLRSASPHPLTPSQSDLLRVVSRNSERHVGEVAPLLGISAPAASKTVDRLERLGLVVSHGSESDRRSRLFSVSPAGRDLVRRCERLTETRLRAALGSLAPRDVAKLTDLLARLSVSLLAAERTRGGHCLRCAGHISPACPVARAQGGCPHTEPNGAASRAKSKRGQPRRTRGRSANPQRERAAC